MTKRLVLPTLIALALSACSGPATPPPYTPPAADATASAPIDTSLPPSEPVGDDVAPSADAAAADAAAPAAVAINGEDVYKKACFACHGAGIAGAPKLGDAADWGPRIAQGDALLLEHAIKGYTGKKGMMPPKGGFMNLSDAEVQAGVDYMKAASQ